MKKIIISLLVASCGLIACTDTQDDYFSSSSSIVSVDSTTQVLDCTLIEFFDNNTEEDGFSEFYELLKNTGIVENYLKSGQDFTVWAVRNSSYEKPQTEEGDLDTARVRYHVNYLAIDKSLLTNGKRLKTISGVYIAITNDASGFFANEAKIQEVYRLKNGVVYVIDKLMVPQLNLYDYIGQLSDDDYSIFKHAVLDSSVWKFDQSKSTPIGVDKTGNTVYDSVTVIDNPLFNTVKINAEDQQFTCFLPNDDVMNSCFVRLRETYEGIGKTFTKDDSLSALLWIKQAVFYNGLQSPEEVSQPDIESAFGKQWRNKENGDPNGAPVQRIKTEYTKLSNAYVYEIDSMKIPMNVIISRFKQYWYHLGTVLGKDSQKYYFYGNNVDPSSVKINTDAELVSPVLNAGWPSPAWYEYGKEPGVDLFTEFRKNDEGKYAYTYLNVKGTNDPGEFSISMTPLAPISLDPNVEAIPYKIPAGEYELHMGVRSKDHCVAKVWFGTCELDSDGNVQVEQLSDGSDGDVKLISGYHLIETNINFGSSTPWNFDRSGTGGQPEYQQRNGRKWNSDGGTVGNVTVEGEGMQIVRIKMEYISGTKRFQPYHWCLIPSKNNY